MIQVIDGEIKKYHLPTTGVLRNGKTVSGYHLLDEDVLKEEGWLPVEDIKPKYDETQYLQNDGYEILEYKVVKKYKVVEIPEPQPSEIDILREEQAQSNLELMMMIASLGGM